MTDRCTSQNMHIPIFVIPNGVIILPPLPLTPFRIFTHLLIDLAVSALLLEFRHQNTAFRNAYQNKDSGSDEYTSPSCSHRFSGRLLDRIFVGKLHKRLQ